MKKLALFFIVALFAACDGKDIECPDCSLIEKLSRKSGEMYLANQYEAIVKIAESVNCVAADQWLVTPVGAKACGGPVEYMAYAAEIDQEDFLKKVNTYTEDQKLFNKKWNISSNCELVLPPTKVECRNGKPVLIN